MVIVGRQLRGGNKQVRTGARRIGQAVNMQGDMAAIPNSIPDLQPGDFSTGPNSNLTAADQAQALALFSGDQGEIQARPSQSVRDIFDLYGDTEVVTANDVPLGETESALGMYIDAAVDQSNGGRTITLTDPASGTQVTMAQQPAQEVVPAADNCTFPAQNLVLQRQVNITNSTPVLDAIQTDQCGNVIGYTETMTRQMSAGEWVPAGPLNGNVDSINNVNGRLQSGTLQGVVYANAGGLGNLNLPAGVQSQVIQSNPLVGHGKRAGGVKRQVMNRLQMGNVNAHQMVGHMRNFRSA